MMNHDVLALIGFFALIVAVIYGMLIVLRYMALKSTKMSFPHFRNSYFRAHNRR